MSQNALTPRRPKGPHLNALRAFEAVARAGSITTAAEELGVTPGAVAQHVKSLEAWAGRALFKRHARGLILTDLARDLQPKFQIAFDQLADAVQDLRHAAMPMSLSIAALPAIAQIWLPSRIAEIRRQAPELSISVFAFELPPNLAREPFDMNIFYQPEDPQPYQSSLGQDCIFPVAKPDIAKSILRDTDILHHPMISDATWKDDWNIWALQTGLALPANLRGPVYSLYSMALQAALDGAGVLIAHDALVRDHLDKGELVQVRPHQHQLKRHLILEPAPGAGNNPNFELVKSVLTAR